jgi:hypothetical protein
MRFDTCRVAAEVRDVRSGDVSIAHQVVREGPTDLGLEMRAGLHAGGCVVVKRKVAAERAVTA